LLCAALTQAADYADNPALPVGDPAAAQLLDMTRAGSRLLAVGARGLVIYSDDDGRSWSQSRVPVSETLTAISFPSAEHGWAVGHGGVILHSGDGGATWQLQFDGSDANRQKLDYVTDRMMALQAQLEEAEEEPDDELQYQLEEAQYAVEDAELALETGPADPFLDVWFRDDQHGWAVGAYGMIYRTDNGGLQWRIAAAGIENLEGYHYYSITATDDARTLYLSGEAGIAYRSDDGGELWQRLDLGYDGSLFGIRALDEDRVLCFGLRGNIFISLDRGATWENVTPEDGPGLSYFSAGSMPGGALLLVGAGGVMSSSEDGRRFSIDIHSDRETFSAALGVGGDLLLAGMGGLTRVAGNREARRD
jgi:photosystem II stability/assembly factor-like uncharacterized protein